MAFVNIDRHADAILVRGLKRNSLTLKKAVYLTDDELLRLSGIGRKSLQRLRGLQAFYHLTDARQLD